MRIRAFVCKQFIIEGLPGETKKGVGEQRIKDDNKQGYSFKQSPRGTNCSLAYRET
jgi:hypothetical protein